MKLTMNKNLVTTILDKYLTESECDTPQTDSSFLELPMFSIALALKAKIIIELGIRNGGTTLPLLLAANINKGVLHSVDINPVKFEIPAELNSNWNPHQQDTLEFLSCWNFNFIMDLVLIDDWHSYDQVKSELNLIDRHITSKSIILLHDTMYGRWEPHYHCDIAVKTGQFANGGPYRAIAELDQNYWEFSTIPVNNGLTILRKKYSTKYHQFD